MAVGASYIWRKYDDFSWTDRTNWTSANYRPVALPRPVAPADARCEPITYFEPSSPLPSAAVYTNVPDRWRDFNGFELTFHKRQSDGWSANASYAYNNAVDVFDSPASYEDPTCVDRPPAPARQIYAPEAGGSGIDNVFINARWLVKAVGHLRPALRPQPRRQPQLAPGLSLPAGDSNAGPRQLGRPGRRAPRSARRDSASRRSRRSTSASTNASVFRSVRGQADLRRVQRDEREHRARPPSPPGLGCRERH